MLLRWCTLLSALAMLTGCATMAGRGPERIPVESNPAGADVSVSCAGAVVATGVTPTELAVPRREDDCVARISKEGFVAQDVLLEGGFNRQYWMNIALTAGLPISLVYYVWKPGDEPAGAVAGLALGIAGAAGLIVDSVTGAKYDHDPKRISVTLAPSPP